jgi:5'-nucleotidase
MGILAAGCQGEAVHEGWPSRVLLTNDNGIDDTGLVELARAFARVPGTDVVVVAATRDRSGASNFMGATRLGEYQVERRDLGPGIEAWALEGYPADCVIFALTGPLRDRPPDVVVSGINGGPNLGDDWFGSGTIGAARTAAYFGIPAVAVSGLEDDDPAAVDAATSWVVDLIQSEVVASLEAPQYLTVSLPVGDPSTILGTRVTERARGLMSGEARRVVQGEDTTASETWRLEVLAHPERAGQGTDVRAVGEGYVAIGPMRANESDASLARQLRRRLDQIPPWRWSSQQPGEGLGAEASCSVPLGITIDDVEDHTGREWGVLVETVEAGSLAARGGLSSGDIVVAINGVRLETEPGEAEDPDDRFSRLYRSIPCGDSVRFRYVRDGMEATARFVIEGP